jgi:hypothetical protein
MHISFCGDRRHVEDHKLLEEDISAVEPSPPAEWWDGNTHVRMDGPDLLIGWDAKDFGLSGSYRFTLRLSKKEIAHLTAIALQD